MDVQIKEIKTPEPSPAEDATKIENNSFWSINKETLRFKLHYFLFMSALGAALPFIAVIAKNRVGLSVTALSAVLTSQLFVIILSKPLIGYLADYFNKLKGIIVIITIAQTIGLFLLLAVPKIDDPSNISQISISHEALKTCVLCHVCEVFHQETHLDSSNTTSQVPELFCYNCSCLAGIQMSVTDVNISKWCSRLPKFDSAEVLRMNIQLNSSLSCVDCFNATNDFISCGYVGNTIDVHPSTYEKPSDFLTYQFWLFEFIFLVSGICMNALFTLSDTACCETIEKSGGDFGRQRMWGAVGWGIMGPFAGFLQDLTDDYIAAWCLMTVLLLLSLWNISKMDLLKPQFSQNILKDFGTVFKSGEFLLFEFGVLLNGIGIGIIWFYLIWFLTALGGNRLLCGLVQTVECFVGEIPFMFFSGWFIKKVGHLNTLSVSLLAYALRFFWYSYLQNPWYVLPIEVAHGVTYGIFYANIAVYGKLSSKPGTEATTQSVLFSTHEGLGAGLGCVLSGLGFNYLGGHRTFFIAGILSVCGMVINIIFTYLLRRRNGSIELKIKPDS